MEEQKDDMVADIRIKRMPYGDMLDLIEALTSLQDSSPSAKKLLSTLRACVQDFQKRKEREDNKVSEESSDEAEGLDLEELHYRIKYIESTLEVLAKAVSELHEAVDDSM